ncbi:MAG: succinyl-diaminopimelate desuccinylase [Rhodocyclaceae bacterium]|nr:succinyl-diaminopimelate desuccinylase [Rhodocyclaceae bacterium]
MENGHLVSVSVLSLAQTLIERPSVTPDDAGCLDLITERLRPLGFVFERVDNNGVSNLWARLGTEGKVICFAGHTDVVPTGPHAEWHSNPFTPEVREGYLYGRGAADMKSSLAACVIAIERVVERRPFSTKWQNSIALLLTSDEEGDAIDGTVRVVNALRARGQQIDYCIVGEPTCVDHLGDTVKNGRRGSLSATLTVKGVQGHVAYPHLVRNPVHLVAPALAELVNIAWDAGNEFFPPTSFQISNAHAGTGAGNVVPGRFELMFNLRFSTASTVEGIQSRVHEVLDRHNLEYNLQWIVGARPFLTGRGELSAAICSAIDSVTGRTATLSTTGGTSDGRFIAEICPQLVEFGPVNASIHKIDERVAVADLEPLAEIYQRTFESLL